MAEPLSPAVQAVMEAAYALPLRNGQPDLAAALEALADQVVPNPVTPHDSCCDVLQARLRREILAIAAELRGGQADG